MKIHDPKQVKKLLDEYVIGQNDVKKIISVSLYNHYKRINYIKNNNNEKIYIEKSNILLIGPTGTGKTLIAKNMAKFLNVPFAISDATSLTEAGYVGEDVESIVTRLLQSSNYDVKSAETGIIFLDEIDKISKKHANPSITRDVSGEGVQQALLKIIEGAIIYVPPYGGRKHPEQQMIPVNTENILFIAGGTFDGLDDIIKSNLDNKIVIGFDVIKNQKKKKIKNDNHKNITTDSLKKFGLIPELIGRFPIIKQLNSLDKKILRQILTEPKNAIIQQYKKLFEMDNINLNITDEALDLISEKAIDLNLGARGLRALCDKILLDYMFDIKSIKSSTLRINKCIAQKKLSE